MLLLNGKIIEIKEFPNREAKITDFTCRPDKNTIELKYEDDRDLTRLWFVKKRIDDLGAEASLFMWYMPYSRMDRQIEGDLFTLKYICDFLAKLNFKHIVILDPHSDATSDLLAEHNLSFSTVRIDWLTQVMANIDFDPKFDAIVLPDKGAAKRYSHDELEQFKNVCVFDKKRDPITGRIESIEMIDGHINPGCKCIIMDDLCSKGGTFLATGQILRKSGASFVALSVTHLEPSVQNGKLLTDESPIDVIYASRSMPEVIHDRIKYLEVEVDNYV